jgi:hypothetical protein
MARRRSVVEAALLAAAKRGDKAAAVALEVYMTSREVPADDPLTVGIRGPLLMVGIRGAETIAMLHPERQWGQEDKLDVIEFLTEIWASAVVDFRVEAFDRWRAEMEARVSAGHGGG